MRSARLTAAVALGVLALAATATIVVSGQGPSGPTERAVQGPAKPGLLPDAVAEQARRTVRELPLAFEPGPSPTGEPGFRASAAGYGVTLSPGGEALVRSPGSAQELRMRLGGSSATPAGEGRDPQAGTANFITGDDPARWRLGVARYGAVLYDEVYPGVDLIYRGQDRNVEYDFVVAPGVDPAMIDLVLEGPSGPSERGTQGPSGPSERGTQSPTPLSVDPSGDLVLGHSGTPGLRMHRPVVFQEGPGGREPVEGSFVVRSAGRVGFRVGEHDPSRPLVIDPVLANSTYFGGGAIDACYGVAVDTSGNVYVTGYTESSDFQTAAPIQGALNSSGARTDAFVAKLNPEATTLAFATYLGGAGRDTGYAIAVGPDGGVYVAGTSESDDFPTTRPVQAGFGGGTSDAFVTKLNPAGTAVEYATMIGGSGIDGARGVAVDAGGNAYVVGSTTSTNFPTTAPVQGSLGGQTDAFVTKVDPPGSAFAYSTYLGGAADDHGMSVAVDTVGNASVTGDTSSENFPTVRPLQPRFGGGASQRGPGQQVAGDAFVSRFDRAGSSLVYSTYLGGSGADTGAGVAVDGDGNTYVTGSTGSTNFPVAKPNQPRNGGEFDAFVSALNVRGSELVYSTYLGGKGPDGAASVAVDSDNRASVVGATSSADFPTADAFQEQKGGGFVDGFLTTYSGNGADLDLSSYLGGDDDDQATGVAVDADGTVRLAGYTNSVNFPTVRPLRATKAGAVGDGFVMAVGEPGAAGSPESGAGGSEDNRTQLLLATTLGLLLAAVVMTLWLRRHPTGGRVAPGPAGDFRPVPPRRDGTPPATTPPIRPAPRPSRAPTAPAAPGAPARPGAPGDPRVGAGRPTAGPPRPPDRPAAGPPPRQTGPPRRGARPLPRPMDRPAPGSPPSAPPPMSREGQPVGRRPEPSPPARPGPPEAGPPTSQPSAPPPMPREGQPVGRRPEPSPPARPGPREAGPPTSQPSAPDPRSGGAARAPAIPEPISSAAPVSPPTETAPTEPPSAPPVVPPPVAPAPSETAPAAREPEPFSPPTARDLEPAAPPPPDLPVPDLLPGTDESSTDVTREIDVTEPDLLPGTDAASDLPREVDMSEPDLWEGSEGADPAPDLGAEELAAWELLISGPAPVDFLEEIAAPAPAPEPERTPEPAADQTADQPAEPAPSPLPEPEPPVPAAGPARTPEPALSPLPEPEPPVPAAGPERTPEPETPETEAPEPEGPERPPQSGDAAPERPPQSGDRGSPADAASPPPNGDERALAEEDWFKDLVRPERSQSGAEPERGSPQPEPGRDLWADEDLPITPSSAVGSGDDWLRLLWSEDLPLPDEAELPSADEGSGSPSGGDAAPRPGPSEKRSDT